MRGRIRALIRKVLQEHDSPQRLSLALGLGVFIGTLPFFGLHLWLALLVATLGRLNRLAVVLGTQISMPWIAPFLILSSLQIGEWILHGRLLTFHLSSFHLTDLLPLFVPWLVGSVALGLLLGIVSYGLALAAITRWRRSRSTPTMDPSHPTGALTR